MIHLDIHGTRLPALGLGTWPLRGSEATDAVERGLRLGYRHIDTAQGYDNEREVGADLRRSAVPRDEAFVVTRLRPSNFGPQPGAALGRGEPPQARRRRHRPAAALAQPGGPGR